MAKVVCGFKGCVVRSTKDGEYCKTCEEIDSKDCFCVSTDSHDACLEKPSFGEAYVHKVKED